MIHKIRGRDTPCPVGSAVKGISLFGGFLGGRDVYKRQDLHNCGARRSSTSATAAGWAAWGMWR